MVVTPARRVLFGLGAVVWLGCPGSHHDPPADVHTDIATVMQLAKDYIGGGPGSAVIETRASQYSAQGGLKGKVLVLAQRPGRLRMEGLSPTDDTVSVLASDGERFTSFQRGMRSCWVGRACPENVGRFASVPLESDALVGVLLGRPPLIAYDSATMKWDTSVGAYRVELVGTAVALGQAKGRVQRLWVGHGDGRIKRVALLEDGKTRVDVSYSEFARIGASKTIMPKQLDVRLARDETDLRLEYRDIDLAPNLEADAFAFQCPDGTNLEEMPCVGGGP